MGYSFRGEAFRDDRADVLLRARIGVVDQGDRLVILNFVHFNRLDIFQNLSLLIFGDVLPVKFVKKRLVSSLLHLDREDVGHVKPISQLLLRLVRVLWLQSQLLAPLEGLFELEEFPVQVCQLLVVEQIVTFFATVINW